MRYLDVVLVVLATPVALALGAPALGCADRGRGVGAAARPRARSTGAGSATAAEPRTQLGLNLFEAFGRIWLLAGAIVIAGVVGGRADGLAAALMIFGAYSVAFAIRVLVGPPPAAARRPRDEPAHDEQGQEDRLEHRAASTWSGLVGFAVAFGIKGHKNETFKVIDAFHLETWFHIPGRSTSTRASCTCCSPP